MIDSLAMPVHLVGHSYGGAVALKVARERPSQIASVILYEPMALHVLRTAGPDGWDGSPRSTVFRPTSIAAFSPAIIVAARQFVEYWNEQGAWDGLREQAQADVIRYMPKACLEFRAVASERTPLAVYRHFRFPVLLLQGQFTRKPTQVIARQLARALRFGSLRTIFGAGHMGPLTHAELVTGLMTDFIERQDDYATAVKSDETAFQHRRVA